MVDSFKESLTQDSGQAEMPSLKKNGELYWVDVKWTTIKNSDGEPLYLLLNAVNITERKKAEQALADEATRRRILIDQSLDGIVVLDENAKVYEANKRFTEMLGYTPEEVRELHTWDWDKNFPPEKLLELGRNVDEKGLHLETKHHRKDGSVIDVDISINGAVIAGQKLIFCVCRDVTERKRAEEKLQTILKTALDGFYLSDLEGKILEVNDSYCKMLGYTREELLEMSTQDIEAIESPEETIEHIKNVMAQGSDRFESQHRRKDGKIIDVEVSVNHLDVGQGQLFVFARDVTERKRVEEALREAELQYRIVADFTYDWEFWENPDGTYRYVSPSCKRITGYEVDEFISNPDLLLGIVIAKDKEIWLEHRRQMAKKRAVHELQFRIQRKDGEIRWIEHVCQPVLDEQGIFLGYRASNRDNTKRKKAEQALRDSEEKTRKMFDSVTDGISVVDLHSVITEVNQRTVEMHGLGSKDELVGKNAFDIVAPHDREKIARNMGRAIKEGTISGIEYTLLKSDGSEFPAELSTSALKDASGKVIGHITIARDITERKQAEEALQTERNKLQSVIGAIEYDLTIQDKDYNIIYQNESSIINSGGNHIGEKCYRAYGGRDKVCPGCPVKKAFKDGKSHTSERQPLSPSGEVTFWENTANPIRDASGEIVSCLEIGRNITERKKAEQALRESNQRFTDIADNALEWIWEVDAKGKYTYASPIVEQILGYKPEEVVGKHFYDLFHPDDREELKKAAFKAFAEKQPFRQFLNRNIHKKGQIVWLSTSGVPILDEKGNLLGFRGADVDITERKRAEQALQAEKNKLQSLIDALEDDLSIQDKNYNILYQNESSRINSGGDRTGEKCYRAYEGKDKVDEDCPVKKAFKDGKSHTSERKWVKPSGEVIFWEVTANPVRDAEGNIVSCLEVARNITERKKTEQALKESEEFSTSLLTNSPNPMLVINQDTSVRYVNPALEKLTGFSPQEVIGRKAPYPWWTEETMKKTAKDLDQAMRQGARRLEELFQKKNGELFWVEITSAPVTIDGEFKYYLANWVDITERKRAEEREQAMQQELLLSSRLASIGELAAGVAHQINNPLTGVLGFSQRLLKRSTDQETKQDLERIYTEAERAAKVVQNLLTFARRRQPHKQYSDINEILESALELRDYELKTSNIEVITNLAAELPEMMLDFYQIQEVFLNIILNAEQALTEAHNGGKLTIRTEKRKGYIRTTFTDDGPGIPAERLDNIFDPFYTTKGEKGGTGLGLSVCHGIITEHGGKIYAKSKPGKGTTFFVELPLTPN
jgi:PAS domain S-box-containing protein